MYAVIQISPRGDSVRIQGEGKDVNREYGVVTQVAYTDMTWEDIELKAAINTIPLYYNSLAENSDQRYFYAQIRPKDEKLHVQVPYGVGNRSYGFAFEIDSFPELYAFCVCEGADID